MSARFGILALQGAFSAHAECLASLGVPTREVRVPSDLDEVDALLMPGGESSTMSQLLESSGLFDRISARLEDGLAVFGTCAGLILLATSIVDGREDQRSFGAIDVTVRRNAYGRQVDSFEADLESDVGTIPGVFIRAPRIERVGEAVSVLATHGGEPVLVRQGNALGATFHPELSGDPTVHKYFVDMTVKGTV